MYVYEQEFSFTPVKLKMCSVTVKLCSPMKELEETDAALIMSFPGLFVQDEVYYELAYL